MINFETEYDTRSAVRVRETAPVVTERVTALPAPAAAAVPEGVSWERVRDYVIEQIIARFGPIPRNPRQENTIFMGFAGRWGSLALPIAVHAFEQCDGLWMGAPVGVHRFHRNADACFAQRIAALLR